MPGGRELGCIRTTWNGRFDAEDRLLRGPRIVRPVDVPYSVSSPGGSCGTSASSGPV